mgnify:FL=1|jgi:hypothetical protein
MSKFSKKFEVITVLVASDDFGGSVRCSALDDVLTAIKEGEGYGGYTLLDHLNPVEKILVDGGLDNEKEKD